METFINLFLNLDAVLAGWLSAYGTLTYVLLFAIVFCESGIVFWPFLPGDSLLFAAGTFAALGAFNIHVLVAGLITAAITGGIVNYYCGARFGRRLFQNPRARFLKPTTLASTEAFYIRHGGKSVFLARFFPIIRTFIPFVAGIGVMPKNRFHFFNVTGAVVWVALFCYASYGFGSLPFVREHFSWIMLGIVVVSLIPVVTALYQGRRQR